MIRVNLTIVIEEEEREKFRNWLEQHIEVTDFRTLPDTTKLYDTNTTFRELCKGVKKAQRLRDDYIHLHN